MFRFPAFDSGPHCGYHWRGEQSFFEGWYYRITLPRVNTAIAFMYSIQDPGGNTTYQGGLAQVLGPYEQYYCRAFPDVRKFWAWPDQLGHGHWRSPCSLQLPRHLNPAEFEQRQIEGYQVTCKLHQGYLKDPSTGRNLKWQYRVEPLEGWGDRGGVQQATAGWLSYLPIFEPGWQILMANGLATGWISIGDDYYTFEQVPAYSEKNWGQSFPERWFWMSCNAFAEMSDLSLTAGGGRRRVLGWTESVGMLGLHYQNKFYEFAPWSSHIAWSVKPWGEWRMTGENKRYKIEVQAKTEAVGVWVQTPTASGLEFTCRDTTQGDLTLILWDKRCTSPRLVATSRLACLEVGGGPWQQIWTYNDGKSS